MEVLRFWWWRVENTICPVCMSEQDTKHVWMNEKDDFKVKFLRIQFKKILCWSYLKSCNRNNYVTGWKEE